jgi:colanic acid biosynthesis glycosyl transferase WcaI
MSRPQRLLIVNRHFWPDLTTYSQILRHIAERWAADGHKVDVITAHPSYRPEVRFSTPGHENINGVDIFRVRLLPFRRLGLVARLINSIPFFLGLIWFMLKRRMSGYRYDFVLVSTNPPVIEALLVQALCAMVGARTIYHIQDVHPDVEVSVGLFKANGLAERFLRRLDMTTCKAAAACVTLSEDMRQTILQRSPWGKAHPEIHIINNFSFDLDEPISAAPMGLVREPHRFRVIFAGNIGHFQGIDQLIAAAHELTDEPAIEIVLVGNGIEVARLKELSGQLLDQSIRFIPVQPMHVASALVGDADLAVIILRPNVIKSAYPSKTMTYASSGTAILAVVEQDSELASTVQKHNFGFVTPPDNNSALGDTIRKAYRMREQLRSERDARRAIGLTLFSQRRALDQWSALINDLAKER